MADNKTVEQVVSLKLLVNKESNKVLFAESGISFVDALCSFLTLPLGTIVRLLQKESIIGPATIGCLNSLYQGVANLNDRYFLNETSKEMLLQPNNSSEEYCNTLKFNIDDTEPTKYCICTEFARFDCNICLYTSNTERCECGSPLTPPVLLKLYRNGFVKNTTFVVSDDLVVMPYSMHVTSYGLVQNYGIKSTSSLQQMTVNVTKEQVLDLLKCSLISKSPLTDMFLEKKLTLERSCLFSCNVQNSSNIQIKVKLVIRKSDGKVLCAQGEEDFANLLLSFLTFPLGGVVSMLRGNCSLGSIDRLYNSIVDIDETKYFVSTEAKKRLVDPFVARQFDFSKPILPIQPSVRYYCYYHDEDFKESITRNQFFISREVWSKERNCRELFLFNNSKTHEGYVKGLITYVATDDLIISRSSPILSLDFLHCSGTPLDDLKEKVVTIGVKECFSILKAALTSTSALTNGLAHLLTKVKEEK